MEQGRLIVLANREPVRHDLNRDGGIVETRTAGGLVTALEPLIEARGGVWIAHGSGTADRQTVRERDGLDVSRARGGYRLRRVWLDASEEQRYYRGFANEGLWPLCHEAHVQPIFRSADFATYVEVNQRFADAVRAESAGVTPVVLVQDYHFALAPMLIRQRLPHGTIVSFWHIPWPNARTFATCPWASDLLMGMLGSTVIGLQTPEDCRNFLDTVEASLPARVDRRRHAITWNGRRIAVRACPVSVEWPCRWEAGLESPAECRTAVRHELGLSDCTRIGVGIDRLDYTKGIPEKFLAVERLLELRPDLVGRFTFVQVAEPSRSELSAYRDITLRVRHEMARINGRFASNGWAPILLLERHHDPAEVFRLLRAADLCHVGSLHDGMNLVAKEFVAARTDERGVLVLSRFAGAARELQQASIVNPYAIDETARTLADALEMDEADQMRRMRTMRAVVAEYDSNRWIADLLGAAARPATRAVWRDSLEEGRLSLVRPRRGDTRRWSIAAGA